MNEATATLFDEFAVAYRRGDAPDVLAYLERAGADADALAGLIDRFLQAVPARATTEEERIAMDARLAGQPPLLALRVQRALGRDAVVDALVRVLGLDPAKRAKVGLYYHELESGLLDPEPVDTSVWDVLADVLKANARRLASFRPPPATAPAASYYRVQDGVDFDRFVLAEQSMPAPAEPDEVDRLFTGRPES